VIEGSAKEVQTLAHGAVILAAGGAEASTRSYAYGASPAILTQSELERRMADGSLDAGRLDTVVMIQCVDSRREPRNYCSRVCCATALASLALKEKPQTDVFVLPDIMAYGFSRRRSPGRSAPA
jgi:heterodisulfide reductase subunit A